MDVRKLLAALIVGAIIVKTSAAAAEVYPSRAITIIAPFPAGSSIDAVARVVGEKIGKSLGQPVVIQNVTGAGGSIGSGRVAHALGDGYTIGIGNLSTHVISGATYKLDFDVVNDFVPVSLLTNEPMVVVAKKSMPALDLRGLIAWLKANPDKASAAEGGTADITHVAYIRFQKETETRFQLVPYRGAGLAINDLLSERIDLDLLPASVALPQLRAGNLKAYAVMAKDRLTSAPDIPTADEAGLQGFYVSYWFGMWAPKGTPKQIIGLLNAAVVDALADDNVRARLTVPGREIFSRGQQTPEALGAFQRLQIAKWWPVIKAAGIKSD
jgi:tripartite-type tricarboxylate transporter receptor subunit TctC